MTNPTPDKKVFKENTVALLATNVATGVISRHPTKARKVTYLFFAQPTGLTAPTKETIKEKGFIGFQYNPEQEEIDSGFSIDVYSLANRQDSREDWGILTVWAE